MLDRETTEIIKTLAETNVKLSEDARVNCGRVLDQEMEARLDILLACRAQAFFKLRLLGIAPNVGLNTYRHGA